MAFDHLRTHRERPDQGGERAILRRWWILTLAGATLASAAVATAARHAGPAWPWRAQTSTVAGPCGGEALSEDTFPPATPAMARAPGPGGTADAPGLTDGRPEAFQPDQAVFDRLLRRDGATTLMGAYSTSFAHASPSQAANIALVARKLTGIVIPPGTVFSYNRATGPFTTSGGYGWGRMFVGNRIVPTIGGGVCQGASTLYNVVLLANLSVVERHLHGLTVPYLPPGRDATVTESGGLDFRFRNTTKGPLVLWGAAQNRRLTLRMYGTQAPPKVSIFTEELARTPFSTRIIRDPNLPPGKREVVAVGQDGVRARAWVVVTLPDGTTERHDLESHTYRPSPRIILIGPQHPPASASTYPTPAHSAMTGKKSGHMAPNTGASRPPSHRMAGATAQGDSTMDAPPRQPPPAVAGTPARDSAPGRAPGTATSPSLGTRHHSSRTPGDTLQAAGPSTAASGERAP